MGAFFCVVWKGEGGGWLVLEKCCFSGSEREFAVGKKADGDKDLPIIN